MDYTPPPPSPHYLLSIKKMQAQRDLKSCCSADVIVTHTSTTSPSFPASLCKPQQMGGGNEAETAARHASLNISEVRAIAETCCMLANKPS